LEGEARDSNVANRRSGRRVVFEDRLKDVNNISWAVVGKHVR
jgi:hypothetical protein